MISKSDSPWLDPTVARYISSHCNAPDQVLVDLMDETASATGSAQLMQIAPDQGALLSLLVGITGVERAIEIGTFTGYSSICIARALAPGGHLLCCDISEDWTRIAQRAWERAGLTERIELRIAPALETLRALPRNQRVDFVFIDADKASYGAYYEEVLELMRPGGLICVDNTLWSGRVPDLQDPGDADTVALRVFNDRIVGDSRVESAMLPIADGLTLIRVR